VENRAMVSVRGLPLSPVEQLFPGFDGSVILVDTRPGRTNNALPSEYRPAAIIDHHPDWGNNNDVPFVDLRDSYGATSTLLTEYLQHAEMRMDVRVATGLFYGISSETQHLGRETMPANIVASQFLYPYVNKRLLGAIETPRLRRGYFGIIAQAVHNALLYDDVVVAALESPLYPDAVAEIADFLLRWKPPTGRPVSRPTRVFSTYRCAPKTPTPPRGNCWLRSCPIEWREVTG
jgi:nanoRNase/pAp phosphatase (c-di-AMP/oligoRNAs hydrolase)